MEREDAVLDLGSRRRIFGFIEKNPGLHLRALQRALEIPLGTLEYHLYQLERSGLVVVRDDGRYKAFFPKGGDLDRRDKDVLYYIRQEVPRKICMELLMAPGMGHGELTSKLPVSASTCSFHLKKLVGAGLVHEERVGRGKRFHVADPDRVAGMLVRYRRSFLDDLVDRFARTWMNMGGKMPDDEEDEGGAASSDEAADTSASPEAQAPTEEATLPVTDTPEPDLESQERLSLARLAATLLRAWARAFAVAGV